MPRITPTGSVDFGHPGWRVATGSENIVRQGFSFHQLGDCVTISIVLVLVSYKRLVSTSAGTSTCAESSLISRSENVRVAHSPILCA